MPLCEETTASPIRCSVMCRRRGASRGTIRFHLGHLLIENPHGLIVEAMASIADGYAEREAATLMMLKQWEVAPGRRRTLGADKADDTFDFVDLIRELNVTPHVTQNLTDRVEAPSMVVRRGTTATP
jgi:hypothetical protein